MGLKSYLLKKFLDGKLPMWMYRFAGKKIGSKLDLQEGKVDTKKWYKSKTVLTAITSVIIGAIGPISTALGHTIIVPNWVLEVLAGIGLYSLRVADKPIS